MVTRLARCRNSREHGQEDFALRGAVALGYADAVGLHGEVCPGCSSLSYWKILRCGCVFVSEAVGVVW
jgi:hypothetical protein